MNKRGKKAQATLFIIIAIIVVALVLLVIYFTGGFKTQFSQAEIGQVKSYLEDCFKLKTQEGILVIARQGGYNTLPEASINFLNEKAPYYWKDNQTLVPSLATVESELAAWLDANARECLSMPGYALTADKCSSKVEIKETTKVLFDCPVTVQKNMASTQLKDFIIEVDAPIAKLLDVSAQVVEDYKRNPGSINLDSLENITEKNQVSINAITVVDIEPLPDIIWFIIQDNNKSLIGENNLTWGFVVEY